MKRLVVSTIAATLLAPAVALAAISCPDRAPAAIGTSLDPTVVKCQLTIAKVTSKFVQTKLQTMAKCHLKQPAGACPMLKDTQKIEKDAIKAADAIAKDCGADAVQSALPSSYSSLTDEGVISSCTLSQNNATAGVLDGILHGVSTTFPGQPNTRAKCVQTISKAGTKYAIAALAIVNKCLASQMKDGTLGNLSPICVGSYSGGAFVPPTDPDAADGLAKLATKTQDSLAKDCSPGEGGFGAGFIHSIFACQGPVTAADVQQCVICGGEDAVMSLVSAQQGETGTFVANGPVGALQAAVDGAAPNTKFLIGSGTYAEQVLLPYTTDGLQFVGCGGATNNRPKIVPPSGPGPFANGFTNTCTSFDPIITEACIDGVDNLLFQSLEVGAFDENGIRVNGSNGVTFRDVIVDGGLNSEYAVFPVHSNNVLVETTSVKNVNDAGIYVGQSTNITVRFNRVEHNVAGIEIENSEFANVHNNFSTNNTGGLLVFKLPDPPVQVSHGHVISHNVSITNNTTNFGAPGSTVGVIPDGTGFLVLSNDDSDFRYNIATGNNSFGFVLIDQDGVNALAGMPVFSPTSPEQAVTGNKVRFNYFHTNGGAPDDTPPNDTAGLSGDIAFFLSDQSGGNHNNCFLGNDVDQFGFPNLGTDSDCTP